MSSLETDVRTEVEEVHRFFVRWFTGTAEPRELNDLFVSRLDDDVIFLSPDGHRMGRDGLVGMFQNAHGNNPGFRIAIRDVTVRRDLGEHVLATYTEWQKAARSSALPENARFTTVLLKKARPFRWLHIHETWLPEAVRAEDSFDF